MPRPSGLRIEPRRNKTAAKAEGFTIVGSVAGVRVRRRAQSNDAKLARKEAAVLETELLHDAWHGERRGVRSFAEAALSYIEAAPRSPRIKAQIGRLLRALGDVKLGQVNQQTATDLKRRMLRPEPTAATYVREVIMPLRAILNHAHKLDWCEVPHFTVPRTPQGRTLYLLPGEVDSLIAAAARHLQPLLAFLVGTGARMSEALELDWQDVDLVGARAIFWRTKGGKRRNAHLPPAVIAALANITHREGRVFRWQTRVRKDGTARHGGSLTMLTASGAMAARSRRPGRGPSGALGSIPS